MMLILRVVLDLRWDIVKLDRVVWLLILTLLQLGEYFLARLDIVVDCLTPEVA